MVKAKEGNPALKGDKEFLARMKDRPEYLDTVAQVRGVKTRMAMRMASAIKNSASTKTLPMPIDEFTRYFPGKSGKQYLKIQLKKFGVESPRVHEDDGVVHIWAGKVV